MMSEGRYRHLLIEEREQIAIRQLWGVGLVRGARRLERSSSTINRERAPNWLSSGTYQPSFAEGSYLARRERLERHERLERFVIDRLTEGWTPDLCFLQLVICDVADPSSAMSLNKARRRDRSRGRQQGLTASRPCFASQSGGNRDGGSPRRQARGSRRLAGLVKCG